MREAFKESPELVRVVEKLLRVLHEGALIKLKSNTEPLDIYRRQGSLKSLEEIQNALDAIRGIYE